MKKSKLPALLLALMLIIGFIGFSVLRMPVVANGDTQSTPTPSLQQPIAAGDTVYQIQPGRSTATFTLTEELHGSPNTVVGSTSQVSGQVALDPTVPANDQVGAVTVDAASLSTDDSQRNRMIQSFILATSQYPSITFTPTAISGMPSSITQGQPFTAQISGLLTIRDQTKPVTFGATVTRVSAGELDGQATATIDRTDWGLQIPSVPLVANVSNQVQLALNFVATSGS